MWGTNAQCYAWAELFRECLMIHGEDSQLVAVQPLYIDIQPPNRCSTRSDNGFLVKNYTFGLPGLPDGYPECPQYPYPLSHPCDAPLPPGVAKVHDAPGVPGQDSANPASAYEIHWNVRHGDRWYDPSYGTGPWVTNTDFVAAEQWENVSIAGFYSNVNVSGPNNEVISRSARIKDPAAREIDFNPANWIE